VCACWCAGVGVCVRVWCVLVCVCAGVCVRARVCVFVVVVLLYNTEGRLSIYGNCCDHENLEEFCIN